MDDHIDRPFDLQAKVKIVEKARGCVGKIGVVVVGGFVGEVAFMVVFVGVVV